MSTAPRVTKNNGSALSARRPGRPRKDAANADQALGRERIFRAALMLIDRGGLGAFNVRELAAELGVAPAAIYWHVASRDALVSGALALALDGVADDASQGPWQQRLADLMRRFRSVLRTHPHLATAVASELAYNAAFNAPLLDQILAVLEDARFEGKALVDSYNVVVAAMFGFATLELSRVPEGSAEAWEQACRAQIDAIDARRQPYLARHRDQLRNRAFLIRWSSGTDRPLDSGFEAWIDVLIRGLESRSGALGKSSAEPAGVQSRA